MMRNSTLLKWAQNNNNKQAGKEGHRNWIHTPDALQRGHIAYLVKFYGNTEVDQPKGILVVKESIRKLKFAQQLRKAEGTKTLKVELTISIDGVAIQEPKTKRIMHQYPLHRISYCADDKGEKRFFSFIAKDADSENHNCFVFVSDKLAEEITLTIGQAFDLAYRRFMETSGKDLEVQRRLMLLQQKVKRQEIEMAVLRQRLKDIAALARQSDVEEYMSRHGIRDLLIVNPPSNNSNSSGSPLSSDSNYFGDMLNNSQSQDHNNSSISQNMEDDTLVNLSSSSTGSSNGFGNSSVLTSMAEPPPVPPRAFEASSSKPFGDGDFISELLLPQPSVGTKLEGLLLDELEEDFNPRAYEHSNSNNSSVFPGTNGSAASPPLLAPPPKVARDSSRRNHSHNNGSSLPLEEDLFGSTPFNPAPGLTPPSHGSKARSTATQDPFGMGDFGRGSSDPSQQELENAIGLLDKRLLEMKDGFSRGLSFGNDDFSLESLDPLRN